MQPNESAPPVVQARSSIRERGSQQPKDASESFKSITCAFNSGNRVFVDIRSHSQYTSSFFYLPPYTLSLPWHFSFNSPQKAVPIYSIFPFSIFEEMSFES